MRCPYIRQCLLRRTQHSGQFVVDEFRHLLAGAHRLDLEGPDRPLAHQLDEAPRDLEADVGFEQVAADLAQRLGHVVVREHAAAGETLQYAGELLESKWGVLFRSLWRKACGCKDS